MAFRRSKPMLMILVLNCAGSLLAAPGDLLLTIPYPYPQVMPYPPGFGKAIAANGTQIIIGAPNLHILNEDGRYTPHVGVAFVFDAHDGQLLYEIPNPDQTNAYSTFGSSVLALGDKFFVASGRGQVGGTLHVYDAASGQHLNDIPAPPGAITVARGFPGMLAGLGDDRIVVATPSEMVCREPLDPCPGGYRVPAAGVLYVLDAHTGETLLRIPHPVPTRNGLLGAAQGLATIGDKIVAGSRLDDPLGIGPPSPGAAYVFDGSTGELLFRLDNPSPESADVPPISDWFGFSISTTNDKIIVGALLEDSHGIINSGAVHVFSATDGEFLFTIPNPDPDPREDFGRGIAGVGQHILVGAWRDEVRGIRDMGTAYLFHGDTGELMLEIPNPADEPGAFGHVVGTFDDKLMIAAPLAFVDGYHIGAVYVFEGIPEPSSAIQCVIGMVLLLAAARRIRASV